MSPLEISLVIIVVILVLYYGTMYMSPLMGTWYIDRDNSIELAPSVLGVDLTIKASDRTEQKRGVMSGYHTACFYDSVNPANDLRICLVPGRRHVAMLMNDTATLASAERPPKETSA